MDSYFNNQITILVFVFIVIALIILFLSDNKAQKLGCLLSFIIVFCIITLPRLIGFKYYSSEVIGTTTGVTSGKSGRTINFIFSYNGNNYTGGNSYNDSVKVNGGRYKVIVSDFISVNGWMDFSQPIE
jgi:hypothetical protein